MAADSIRRGDTPHAMACEEHLELLRACRRAMLEPIEVFRSTSDLELSFTEFAHGFRTLGERKRHLQAHPELLGDRITTVAQSVIDQYAKGGNADIVATFRLYRNLLLRCGDVPIDQAFAEYEVPPSDVISAFDSLWGCDSPQEILTCSLVHGEQLGSRWMQNCINFHRVKCEDNPAAMKKLESIIAGSADWY